MSRCIDLPGVKALVLLPDESRALGPVWEPLLVQPVQGEALSHALYGWAQPLLRQMGRPPRDTFRVIPEDLGACELRATCPFWDPKACRPSAAGPPKMCWVAQGPAAVGEAMLALREGRRLLRPDSDGFVLG